MLFRSPRAVRAQQAVKVFRIGILGNVPLTDAEGKHLWGGFIQELRTFGYVEGRNLTIEHRSSEGRYERLAATPATSSTFLASSPIGLRLSHDHGPDFGGFADDEGMAQWV